MADQLRFVFDNLTSLLWGVPNNRPGGLVMTLILSVVGLGFGLALAVLVSLARRSAFWPLRLAAEWYVRVIRGIPLVLLLLLTHRFVAVSLGAADAFGAQRASLLSAAIALVLYGSSYQADVISSGLRAVPPALVEETRLLGGSAAVAYFRVELPYGLRVMQPALLSQAITLFKDSSVVVVLGVADLTTTARIVLGADVTNAPYWVATYLAVGALYFVIAFALSRWADRRAATHVKMGLISTFD